MHKTEVYSWRLSPHLKAELEEAARAEQKSMAELLEGIAEDWLQQFRGQGDEAERQQRLRESAMRFVGSLEGARSDRAASARTEVRARIARRHGR
ncbi:MAG TPA: hypothetical protein VF756_29620 [Thermoanaerobaculia bacterium]